MTKLAEQSRSASGLMNLLISCGLLALMGGALYMLAAGHSTNQVAARQLAPQSELSQPLTRAHFKATATPGPTLVASTVMTPSQGQGGESQRSEAADEIVAEVNNVALSKRTLQIVLDADRAVALLLNTPIVVDRTAALERLVNGELVRQATQPTGFVLDEATVQHSLQTFLTANQKSEQDLMQALNKVNLTRAEFDRYFGRLLLIDRFVHKQAEQLALADSTYLLQLQQTAHISFGPAAVPILVETVNTVAASGKTPLHSLSKDAIPFALPVLNDTSMQTLTLNNLLGHPTVLSFWTTWCPYCKRQTPILVDAHAHYTKNNIQFVGINVKDAYASVQAYITANHIPYSIPLDSDGRVASAYNVHGFPTTLFLDAQGHIVARHIGALTPEKLTEYIHQLAHNTN